MTSTSQNNTNSIIPTRIIRVRRDHRRGVTDCYQRCFFIRYFINLFVTQSHYFSSLQVSIIEKYTFNIFHIHYNITVIHY